MPLPGLQLRHSASAVCLCSLLCFKEGGPLGSVWGTLSLGHTDAWLLPAEGRRPRRGPPWSLRGACPDSASTGALAGSFERSMLYWKWASCLLQRNRAAGSWGARSGS